MCVDFVILGKCQKHNPVLLGYAAARRKTIRSHLPNESDRIWNVATSATTAIYDAILLLQPSS